MQCFEKAFIAVKIKIEHLSFMFELLYSALTSLLESALMLLGQKWGHNCGQVEVMCPLVGSVCNVGDLIPGRGN
jgi:hypothetical protein